MNVGCKVSFTGNELPCGCCQCFCDTVYKLLSVERWNLGCRTLVYHNFSKILTGIVGDLGDWVVQTRLKSAQLLYTLILNEEHNVTQHVDKLLTAVYRTTTDDEPLVVRHVRLYFIYLFYLTYYFLKYTLVSKDPVG